MDCSSGMTFQGSLRINSCMTPPPYPVPVNPNPLQLKQHLDEPVRSGERTLVLRSWEDKHIKLRVYGVRTITAT